MSITITQKHVDRFIRDSITMGHKLDIYDFRQGEYDEWYGNIGIKELFNGGYIGKGVRVYGISPKFVQVQIEDKTLQDYFRRRPNF